MTFINQIQHDISRDDYLLRLDACMHKMLETKNEALCGILVSGYTGSGKTFLIENYIKNFEGLYPVLVSRHNLQHEGIPYFGFKYGFSDFINKIHKQFSPTGFQDFSSKLKGRLGESFPMLLEYIPELSLLAGNDPEFLHKAVPKIENQLYPLFKTLFEFLADYYNKPVIFFTDDLQWIDVSGVNLLKYLILNLSPNKLIWIGASRAPQENINAVRQLNEALGFAQRTIENIFLSGLSEKQVSNFMETALRSSCHEAFVKVCFDLSEGNPSHLQVLLESLKGSDHIWQKNGQWFCDEVAVKAKFKGRNTKIILRERLKSLSPPTREMLSIMACMGLFSRRTIKDWLIEDHYPIDDLVAEATVAGLLEQGENNIRFSEMHLGEMIYSDLPVESRQDLHYKIAKLLYARGMEELNATKVILMTTHFDQALELVKFHNESLMVAELNYKAGNYAKQDNALDQARYFFKMSADLIKDYPRNQAFDLGRLVYMERAKVEYHLGEYDLAEIHLDYLLDRLTDPVKRAKAFELKITINNHLGRYRKAVYILKEALLELGLELPLEENRLLKEIDDLKKTIALSEEKPAQASDLLDLNKEKTMLKLLNVGGMSLHHTSDVLMTWAALQIINRSGRREAMGVRAIGYVSYGRMLIIGGEIEKGVELGKKGLTLNDLLEDIDLRCRVYGVYAFYIQPWMKSFADSMRLLDKGIEAGRKSGDLIGLYILKTHQFNLHFISGLPLRELLKWDFQESYSSVELTYYITHYQKSLIRFLVGENAVFSIPSQQGQWQAARLTIQEEKFYRNYVWGRYYFLFGHYALAEGAAREANRNRKLQEGSPLVPSNLILWFLSITQNWDNFSHESLPELEARAKEILDKVTLWHTYAPQNYTAPWWLMQAEWLRIQGDVAKATQSYEKALEACGTNIYYTAVAHELLAKHLLSLPDERKRARTHLLEAIKYFERWGAVTKSKQLVRQYQAFLMDLYPQWQEIDIETIQHELSGDMEVASLVKKLLVMLLRISGSTRVVIELIEEGGNLSSYGELSLLHKQRHEKENKLNESVPASMILMAHRMQQPLVVNDLIKEKGTENLKAIQGRGVQSFLIVPLTVNGHVSMVVYLESIFAQDWYIKERIKWIRIAANQGAVIIENASIHERSVKLNKELRKEMAEKERLASLIEAQKDAHLKDLVQTQDKERKRIAADLHDSLGSLLSSIKLRFDGLQEDFGKGVSNRMQRYNDTLGLLDEAIQELRRIAHNMSPVALRRFGLKAALQSFVEQINASEKMDADLQVLGLDERLPEEIEIAAYRVCQELVQNVIKHAKTSTMRIQIIAHADSLNIIVEDNGIGMNRNMIAPGFGFSTIESKMNLFKGTFTIESQPGKGTMAVADFPLS